MNVGSSMHAHCASQDVGSVLRHEYPQGIDLVYEGVGGAMFATAMANLHPRGRVLVLGYISHYPHNGACLQGGGLTN